MELEFLTIDGEYQHKELYLQHISEMINVELSEGETSNDLFEKLRKRFDENVDKLKAVEDWISFNKEQQDDESVFETVLCEKGKCYAAFNLRGA